MTTPPVLEVRDLVKDHGRLRALDGVSLSVTAGEMFGLLGPNGAGKTTLLSILAGLSEATSGQVTLFGETYSPSERHLRRRVGLVTQDLAIYPELTAAENLRFFGKLYGMGEGDLTGRAAELLEAVGLADRTRQRSGTFSGGMKRRLNLAVALIHRPEILFLDEPTTGVDPQSRNRIFDLVRGLNAGGMTVIYTSHYMEEVQSLCPRTGIIDGGRLIACDAVPALLATLNAALKLELDPWDVEPVGRRCGELAGVVAAQADGPGVRLECSDLTTALLGVTDALRQMGVRPRTVRTEEPNLERVFLHLTGRDLRD